MLVLQYDLVASDVDLNNINEVNQKLAEVIDEINNKKVELNAIQLEEKTVIPHVENLVELEEKKDQSNS